MKARAGLAELRGVLLDIDGVLYVGAAPVPGAVEAVARLRAVGLPIRFVTNTTRQPRRAILERLAGMGFPVAEDELFTPAVAAQAWLRARSARPFLLVHPDLLEDFRGFPSDGGDAVVLGDAGEAFTYAALNRAFRLILAGAPLLALAANRYFRQTDGLSLDAGAFVAALEYASETRAEVLGKPAAAFYRSAVAGLGCAPGDAVMVGDDVDADVNGAIAAGIAGILVRTGKFRAGDEARLDRKGLLVPDIGAAVANALCGRRT